jgi:NAD(P)-dependent dehydrogenase (short-subunit alcohol dehydrogenase family)
MTTRTERALAVVTGGSSGIGRAAARRLAAAGWDLAIGYHRDLSGAQRTLGEIRATGAAGTVFQMEAADPALARAQVEEVVSRRGELDVLVNSAGINRRANGIDESTAGLRTVLAINAETPIALAQYAAANMGQRGGAIINITSVHEHIPIVGGTSYCASKAALGAATKVLALETAALGISVNAIAPGETATPMNSVPDDVRAEDIARPAIPAGRPASPDEIAALAAFLADPINRYITGQSVVVDGGMHLTAAVENAKRAHQIDTREGNQ